MSSPQPHTVSFLDNVWWFVKSSLTVISYYWSSTINDNLAIYKRYTRIGNV